MPRPIIVNQDDVEWEQDSHGERFAHRRKALAENTSRELLGCSLYAVPPGKRPFPYHYHTENEEAIYVLQGHGTLRTASDSFELGRGDYVALPTGEAGARQVINSSDQPLQYLCISTMIDPEIIGYPDSEKFGLFAGSAPFGPLDRRTLTSFLPEYAKTEYWAGEN